MGEPRPGESQVSPVTPASITGDQICWEGVREGVTENSLECDLVLNHVGTGLHVRVVNLTLRTWDRQR